MSFKKRVATAGAAVAMGICVTASSVVSAQATTWYPKDFYGGFPDGYFGCTDYLYNPPSRIQTDQWYGCKLIGNGTYRLYFASTAGGGGGGGGV